MNQFLTLSILLVLVSCALAQSVIRKPTLKIPEVDAKCMDCICQASSNCDETIKCHNSGPNYFCGPFVISWAYWHDGGKPGNKGGKHDFETCLNNKTCAEMAVRGYMRKYGQDCDANDAIDCSDFARIHKLGFGSCGGDAIYTSDYWEKFEICYTGRPSDNSPNDYDYGSDGVIQARNPGFYD